MREERLKLFNGKKINEDGDYVLYWMQNDQRILYNHALYYAIKMSNKLNKTLLVYFGLTFTYPEANERHYYFMLEGILELKKEFENLGINFIILNNSPDKGVLELEKNACLTIIDKGYLKIQKFWRDNFKKKSKYSIIEVDTALVVPVENTSYKEEYAAYTIRKKINSKRDYFLNEIEMPILKNNKKLSIENKNIINLNSVDELIKNMNINKEVKKTSYFKGGTSEAIKILDDFIKNKLNKYDELRNEPSLNYSSNLSPYLHFGQISPVYISLKILKNKKINKEIAEKFLEELIVRRELAFNFVYYNNDYDIYEKAVPDWALKTLEEHKSDKRKYLYSLEELENAKTHDVYWNKAEEEMKFTGKMNNYMRMYWGKKIIEWTESPELAFKVMLYLNNKYSIDGRDANSFAGIAWCFGKHDRPWKEREIFGKIRYMNEEGLKRKFDMKGYLNKF